MSNPEITAIIPVFNDRASLETALPVSIEVLDAITPRFEIIVAEDGSSDGSADLVREFSARDARVQLLHSDTRLGRGKALNRAITRAQGEIVCYYDVDLATNMQHVRELVLALRNGADIATGSRLLPASDTVRTGGREIASRSYNFLVRLLLGSRIYDHQCGFKGFRRERILPLLEKIRSDHWFWDTEILVRAQLRGYAVYEFPVHWRAGKGTTVRLKDIFSMGSSILRLWWQVHVSED
ncbi:MAG: glycosyl transferase [Methanomicrobiales archaeon HGW-Methanomicrobiales-3]|jgi:glycosyltransferase involved in cell wall biosynthesis|nr:MAG: glycosyl transferase [Methanomicrobiales archaeon HGW-Methanomicrobiales-3]